MGSRLEHGEAHTEDHLLWSRRTFLSTMGLAGMGSVFMLGHSPVKAFGLTPLLAPLGGLETDRVLVLIQLDGGNDGLNTIVPITNDIYYRSRPTLAIPANQTIRLSDTLGMHPSMADVEALYGDGQMAIVQNVGYDNPDQSHFRSMDIWMSGSDAEDYDATGWAGRALEAMTPDFGQNPPQQPLGVQLGGSSMLFQGRMNDVGMTLSNPEVFERLAETGQFYNVANLPATTYGDEMLYIRQISNSAFRYAGALQQAAQAGQNRVEYPEGFLAENLSSVARLIKGQLGTRIYVVSLFGFDTHAEQVPSHPMLLQELTASVKAFIQDLEADNQMEDVLVMTFSEFGRTIWENGSGGTDHSTSAPLFLFGPGAKGGLYGAPPDLQNINEVGDPVYDIDFRSVYATVLQDWFGIDSATVSAVLGRSFSTLPFINAPTNTATEAAPIPEAFALHQNYPNPFNPQTTIPYTLLQSESVRIRVYDVRGRLLSTLVDQVQPAGQHAVTFEANRLPSGVYFYRLETPAGVQTKEMTLVR
ncbi:MAG: DUF1501 domain-containing protein [Bacteroidetes bacterium]|nr:DUF1501 domain-containing protein [Bacteroidota bacterium]